MRVYGLRIPRGQQACPAFDEQEPYALTSGTLIVLPEGGPYAGIGVVRRMAQIGITVTRAVEQTSPRLVTAEEAALLGVQKGTLATHIQRTYYAEDGRPVETADIVVPHEPVRNRLRGPGDLVDP